MRIKKEKNRTRKNQKREKVRVGGGEGNSDTCFAKRGEKTKKRRGGQEHHHEEASHLESGPVLDSIFREAELHVDLFPPHDHRDPFHLEVGICGLDGVTDDLSF